MAEIGGTVVQLVSPKEQFGVSVSLGLYGLAGGTAKTEKTAVKSPAKISPKNSEVANTFGLR